MMKQQYNFDAIPQELRSLPQWLLWKFEERGNKPTKVPYQANGEPAQANNRSTFGTFPTMSKFYDKADSPYDGIGFVFTRQDDYIGIDIDDCVVDGKVNEFATEVIETLDSYTEFSPSGKGIHIIIKGILPKSIAGTGRKSTKHGLEIYAHGRYFTFSGNRENDNEVYERTEEIAEVFEKYFDDSEAPDRVNLSEYTKDEINLSNSELWNKMFSSKSGSEIESLYKGNLIDGDHSSTDLALCNHLAFWTGKSYNRMDSMFRESSLMRDKWDIVHFGDTGETYGERTISRAIASTSTTLLDYKSIDDSEFKFNFAKVIPEKDLEKILKQRNWDEVKLLKEHWILSGMKGTEPSALSAKHCSDILQEYIKFILYDLEENTRLSMYNAAQGIYTSNVQYIKRVISWLEPRLNDSKANDVIYHLTNDAEIKPFTVDRYLVAVNNGIFNLKTKELEPFSPDYVFNSKIATNYNGAAVNKTINGWDIEDWISSIACDDEQIKNLLWEVINDSLNGNYTRKKSIFLLGDGNNGKGTFQDLLINLIGYSNVATLRVNEFDERFKLSMLEGKTVVIGDDVQAGVNIDDSANFNSVVTGDRVSVEQKNKPMYSSTFRCTVIQSTNGMPTFKNKTSGTMRRLIIVPFNANFNGEKENYDIKEIYINDKEILEYVLYKSINMDFERFTVPDASLEQLEEFEIDNDPVVDFKISIFDKLQESEIPKKFVYSLYVSFCKDSSFEVLPNRKFFKQFKKILDPFWKDSNKRFSEKELEKLSEIHFIPFIEKYKKEPLSTVKRKSFNIC